LELIAKRQSRLLDLYWRRERENANPRFVFEYSAVSLYFAGRKEIERFIEDVCRGRNQPCLCEINVAEFLYSTAKVLGWETAIIRHSVPLNIPIKIVTLDGELILESARLKHKYWDKLSLAYAYLAALAKRLRAKIVTSDTTLAEIEEAETVLVPL
jgi:predicted nucleic acid-binding protein